MTDKYYISNYMNKHFCTVGEKLSKKIKVKNSNMKTCFINDQNNFNFYKTNELEIISIIKNLKSNSAPGIDDITTLIIQRCSKELAKPLVKIMNKIIDTGIYPEELKIAKVIPIFKGGDRTDASNYRPISILSIIAKIFDKIIDDRLMKFLKINKFISHKQFAFTENSSTDAAVYNVINNLQMHLDKKK